MSAISDLVSTCYGLRQQTVQHITVQIEQLRRHAQAQMAAIRQWERSSSSAQQTILEQLRPHLATDARSLLLTAEFAAFVQELRSELKAVDFRLQVQPPLKDWVLPTLSVALQVHDIEARSQQGISHPCAFETQMRVQVQDWQHPVVFPAILYATPQRDVAAATHKQWLTVRGDVSAIAAQLTVAPAQQQVCQEVFCLLRFIGELFTLRELANALQIPGSASGWFE